MSPGEFLAWSFIGLGILILWFFVAPTSHKPKHRKCRWHRWNSIEQSEWVSGIAYPKFRFTCRKCGVTRTQQFGP